MSAVLKEVVTQVKPVTELFSAADFYTKTPDVVSEIKNRIAIVNSIAFEVTENGKRSLKDYQADERRLIKATDAVRKEEYARLTGETKKDHDAIFEQIKAWSESVASKSIQFEEFEANILKSIRVLLKVELANIVNQCNTVRPEFLTAHNIEPLVKLTGTLTASGKLTTKANEALRALIVQDLAKQQLHDNRLLTIENRCLRADINPPLGMVHFGEVFWADDVVFEAKVEQLVTAEIARRVEMELRIEAKNKADNQKKIDDALAAQQAETNRIANEKAKTEEPAKPVQEIRTPESLRASAARIQESAQRADRGADRDAELKGASDLRAEANALEIAARIEEANALESTQPEQVKIPGKKTVTITAKFEVTVSERISVEAVVNHLKSKLSDDLKEILIDCTGY
jgi:hypothetical protein